MIRRYERDELYPYSVETAREILVELEDVSDGELFRFCKAFDNWNWPVEWLGEKPEGWEEMPNYRKPYMGDEVHTKDDFIHPYMVAIKLKSAEIYCKVRFGD